MTLYYRGPDAVVTDETLELWHPYQRFRIEELDDIHVVRWPLDPMVVRSAHALAGALLVVAVLWPAFAGWPNGWLLATALVGGPSLVGITCRYKRPRSHELRAAYRGYRVVLYTSCDARAFEQVRRALLRAKQSRDEIWGLSAAL